jgi:tetratricopeptide (TPR) repeat protein
MTHWLGLFLVFAQASQDDAARLFESGNLAGAAAAYQEKLKAHPDSAGDWAGLGRTLQRLGRSRDAVLCLRKALQLKPGDTVIESTLARIYLAVGDTGEAIALLEPLTTKEPSNTEFRLLLGEVMYRGGYYAHAAQLLEPTANADAGDRRRAGMYAVSLAKTGRSEEAAAACKRLLDPPTSPLDLDVVLTYVELLDDAGRHAEALTFADRAVKDQPSNPAAHLWKARLLWHSDQTVEAAREAEASIALAPALPFARSLLLQIDRKLGRAEDAQRQADWLRAYNGTLLRGHE